MNSEPKTQADQSPLSILQSMEFCEKGVQDWDSTWAVKRREGWAIFVPIPAGLRPHPELRFVTEMHPGNGKAAWRRAREIQAMVERLDPNTGEPFVSLRECPECKRKMTWPEYRGHWRGASTFCSDCRDRKQKERAAEDEVKRGYWQNRNVRPKLRFQVLTRDRFTCQYCGRSAPDVKLEVDHVIPVAEGGLSIESNLRTACWECNIGKCAMLLPE